MHSFDFDKSRSFLEYMIEKNPENKELIQAYVKLVEKRLNLILPTLKVMPSLRRTGKRTKQRESKQIQK